MDYIYLDYAATTPVDPDVVKEMERYFLEDYGNPSSVHYFGQKAEAAVSKARHKLAENLNVKDSDVIFTGSGSEGDNLAVKGVAFANKGSEKNKILVSPVEHPAVLNAAKQLMAMGFIVEKLRIDSYGTIDTASLSQQIDNTTMLVSAIYGNNEIGTINPIREIGKICRERGVLFHTDAVQACAHLPIDIQKENIDLLTLAAHKFYGPKGVGALICLSQNQISSQIAGGKQENNLRAGTHNVPGIVGMAAAFERNRASLEGENQRLQKMRDTIIEGVLSEIPGSQLTGHPTLRLPNHASFVFEGVNGNDLLILLDMAGFACSSGSACKVGDPKPSDILLSLGIPPELALGSLRVTLGKQNTMEQVDKFLSILPELVKKLRKK